MKTRIPHLSSAAAAVLGLSLHSAIAAVTPINPFTGTMSESFESFAPDVWFPGDSWPIMGGGAAFSVPLPAPYSCFEARSDGEDSLGSSGPAHPSDGNQYAYLYGYGGVETISFAAPVQEFGGYFATFEPGPDPVDIQLSFFDQDGNNIDSLNFSYSHAGTADGLLDWHGWSSDVGIESIVMTSGLQIMMDGLQATTVPEPSSFLISLTALGIFGTLRLRNRR